MYVSKELEEKQIAIFQRHLGDYMEIFNITTEELGRQLGVSRTQISNLRSGYSKMSKAQWIAIRVILSSSEDIIENHFRTAMEFRTEIKRIQLEKLTKLQNLIEEESQ